MTQVQWTAPASMWPVFAAQAQAQMRQPQMLRFATDTFMDEYMNVLNYQPEKLIEWQAQPEKWHAPSADPAPVAKLPPMVQRLQRLRLATASPSDLAQISVSVAQPSDKLKLYQPAHGRFYLVTGCLVCRLPGLPDRVVDNGAGERVSYVVRRLRPKAGASLPSSFDLTTCDEYAYVEGKGWQQAAPDALVAGEEQLPLFGVTYVERDGRKRRVLGAVVPVGKRETYVGAPAAPRLANPPNTADIDPRKSLFMRQVADPWRSLIRQYNKAGSSFDASRPPGMDAPSADPAPIRANAIAEADAQAVWLSWLVLSDFSDYLEKYLNNIWLVVKGDAAESTLTDAAALNLYRKLRDTAYTDPNTGRKTLAQALVAIRAYKNSLDTDQTPFTVARNTGAPTAPFPNFRFRLHDAALAALVMGALPADATAAERPHNVLDDWVNDALPDDVPPNTPPLPLAAQMTKLDAREPLWFVIRFVFEQPNCEPLVLPLLSEASRPFQMASFFDPEAPARPIRITLPLDTTAAGLRKFDKNTAFMISDVLCGQMQRMGGLTFGDLIMSVLPWPLHKDLSVPDGGACEDGGDSFGMICSLSIPIITICALILLIIIVNLLDLIFRWIPFFIMCFPLPNFKGKES